MTLLLIIPVWLLVLSVMAGLCCAARLGDAQGKADLRALERDGVAERVRVSTAESAEAPAAGALIAV